MKDSLIGSSVPRVDAFQKVTGSAPYINDYNVPSCLHAKVLRSPYAHAQIVSIDIVQAARLQGIKAIITGKDCGGRLYGMGIYDTPVLALDRVLYVGEPVAAVAANSLDAAEEALEKIHVEYRELPVLLDPEDALRTEPPLRVHQDYSVYGRPTMHAANPHPDRPNVANYVIVEKGAVEEGFKNSSLVIENRYTAPMLDHCSMEPHVAVARWDAGDSYTIWTSTQSLYRLRSELTRALGIPATKLRIITSYVGGGFGSKVAVSVEPIAALLAKRARKPVRLAMTREEIFSYNPPRHPFIIEVKDGASRDGRLIARQLKIILDGGAYSGGSGYMVARTCISPAIAAYRVDNLLLESYRVSTNKVPGGPWRGVGEAQVNWAIEEQMDILAEEVRIDPIEVRLRNLLTEGETTATGAKLVAHSAESCIEAVTKAIAWKENGIGEAEGAWLNGKGLAVAVGPGGGRGEGSVALVKVQPDGTLDLWIGGTEIGEGTYTVMSQIVAHEFRTSIDRVRVALPDTTYSPFDPGAFASRQTFILGNAVIKACVDAKMQLFSKAALMLDSSSDQLEMQEGTIYVRDDSSRRMSIEDLFRGKTRMGPYLEDLGEFIGRGSWGVSISEVGGKAEKSDDGRTEVSVTSSAAAALVSVNRETGHIRPLRLVVAVDVGRAINPTLALEQIRGGAFMGLSTALAEELVTESGRIVNPDYKDYKILSALDACVLEPLLIEKPSPEGPYGAKGIGEIPTVSIASAIGNAVCNATGVRFRDLPLTAERVLSGLRASGR